MSIYARLALAALLVLAAGAAWWKVDRMFAAADRRGYERAAAEGTAAELERSRANAATTIRRLDVQGENHDRSAAQLSAARADAARARDAARVQDDNVAVLESIAAGAAASESSAVAARQAAADAARMLADMQRRTRAFAGVVSEHADAARIAGNTCVADYNALRR